ncbi:MAG: outer membrane protein assembly factor BamD [Gammaproteobacteria bacterium]|nr:MAG: outer membrane protein assembly factor BamD [Gammaproteobacteria bacterium]
MVARTVLLILLGIMLTACGASKEIDVTADWSADQLYRNAKRNLENEDYITAIEQYEILESRYPFGKFATQAQLDVAYAYYKYDEPEAAVVAIERFIKLNPRHKAVDYAYYLRGLVNFERGGSIIDVVHERDLSDYDKTQLQTAFNDFQLLLRKYPKSKYARDARQRLVFLRNEIARADLKIAQYYVSREAWVAAANRAKTILQSYPGTTAIKPALKIQLQAYRQLGLDELVADTQRIIDLNSNL